MEMGIVILSQSLKPVLVAHLHSYPHTHNRAQSYHRKGLEPEQAGKLWKTRIQFGTYGA